jgi:hypothetical protein
MLPTIAPARLHLPIANTSFSIAVNSVVHNCAITASA